MPWPIGHLLIKIVVFLLLLSEKRGWNPSYLSLGPPPLLGDHASGARPQGACHDLEMKSLGAESLSQPHTDLEFIKTRVDIL